MGAEWQETESTGCPPFVSAACGGSAPPHTSLAAIDALEIRTLKGSSLNWGFGGVGSGMSGFKTLRAVALGTL